MRRRSVLLFSDSWKQGEISLRAFEQSHILGTKFGQVAVLKKFFCQNCNTHFVCYLALISRCRCLHTLAYIAPKTTGEHPNCWRWRFKIQKPIGDVTRPRPAWSEPVLKRWVSWCTHRQQLQVHLWSKPRQRTLRFYVTGSVWHHWDTRSVNLVTPAGRRLLQAAARSSCHVPTSCRRSYWLKGMPILRQSSPCAIWESLSSCTEISL